MSPSGLRTLLRDVATSGFSEVTEFLQPITTMRDVGAKPHAGLPARRWIVAVWK
jgi:hypothetical protein